MPTRAVFRGCELFYVLIILGLGLALLPAISKSNPAEVLPVIDNGLSPIFSGLYKKLIYFEPAAILLLFHGDIKTNRKFTRTFMSWAGICAIVFIGFVFLYYTMFGPLTIAQPLSVVNITGQSSYISQNGRLEWIIACIWLVLLLIRFGVTFFACFATARYVTHIRFQPAAIAFPLALIVFVLYMFVFPSFADLKSLITMLRPFILVFYILIPIIAILIIINLRNSPHTSNKAPYADSRSAEVGSAINKTKPISKKTISKEVP